MGNAGKDGQYLIDYEIVRVPEFNRSDPHIFMQLYTHWRKEKYSPQDLVDMNALTCVLGVLQRANPENIIYGSIIIAATMCLLYTMEGPHAFERLIQSETKRLQNEERSKQRNELKRDLENYANGISKVNLTSRSKTVAAEICARCRPWQMLGLQYTTHTFGQIPIRNFFPAHAKMPKMMANILIFSQEGLHMCF